MVSCCEHCDEHKMQGVIQLAVELLTSQGRPCFVELVSSYKER